MKKVMLYAFISDDIKIRTEAYFDENKNLLIDGYDIGKSVERLLGDSDYESLFSKLDEPTV